jgi:hypothetical protein
MSSSAIRMQNDSQGDSIVDSVEQNPVPKRIALGSDAYGAIHGVLLTAWSAAAIAGPVIITQLSARAKASLAPGARKIHIYDQPLEVLAALLAVGFVLTLLVRPTSAAKIAQAR